MRAHRYRITVRDGLGKVFQQAFEDFTIEVDGAYTWLSADLDQAAPHGALDRIQSLGLGLVQFTRLSGDAGWPTGAAVRPAAGPGSA